LEDAGVCLGCELEVGRRAGQDEQDGYGDR
jgi:hypothetical protein